MMTWSKIRKNYDLYLLLLPTVIFFIIFEFGPMYGVQIAFKRFVAVQGIFGSPWVGFSHFERFFHSFQFWNIIENTLLLSLYQLAIGFPVPIVFALLLNQIAHAPFRKWVQTVTYAPHFISTVVVVGMLFIFLSPRNGLVNLLLKQFGRDTVFFMASPEWFKSIYVFSGVWQEFGFSAIIYLAALAGVNPELHESAIMDGATKLQRIRLIDLPGIMPTIVILFILSMGNFTKIGFEKVYLMQTALNIPSSEIIATYVYKIGLLQAQYSYASAIGLFNSVITFVLLIVFNMLAKRLGQASLW